MMTVCITIILLIVWADQIFYYQQKLEMSKFSLGLSKLTTSQGTSQLSLSEEMINSRNTQNQSKLLYLLASRLFTTRLAYAFEKTRLLPMREKRVQGRMKKVIEGVFRRQDYLSKWQGFQNIRRMSLITEKREHTHLKDVLKKQRGIAIRLITAFMIGKKRDVLHSVLGRLRERGQIRTYQLNSRFRVGIRSIIKIFAHKTGDAFSRIRDSRVIIGQAKNLRIMFKIVKEIRSQNMRWAFVYMRRQMLRSRQQKAKEDIKQLDQKLGVGEDEQMKGLQDKFKELNDQLQSVKKEREDIQANLDAQMKHAETRTKEMKEYVEQLKVKQEQMKQQIVEVDEKLKTPFSLEEIYQLCYQNLLWTVSQNTQKNFNKEDLLRSLETPLVPIDLPIDQLKEQNDVLKQLLSEYVLLYGQKRLPEGCKLQIPYQNLLKQNNLLYKMLMTLLPNAQFLKEELLRIRQTHESVETMIKQYGVK